MSEEELSQTGEMPETQLEVGSEPDASEVKSEKIVDPKCQAVIDDLSALIDGQLSGSRKTEVDEHLAGCQDCRLELDGLKQVQSFLSKAFAAKTDDENAPDIWAMMSSKVPGVCDVIQEDLSAYLDGELTVPAQEGVNKHLKECETCLAQFKDLNATNRLLVKGLELPGSVDVDIWNGVKSRLNADCDLIDNELSAYLDQEVASLRHRAITKHLTDCASCQAEFAKLSSVGDLIRDAYKPAIPDDLDLWPGIKSKLQVVQFTPKKAAQSNKSTAGANVIPRRYYIGAACAAGVVAIFGVAAMWLSGGESNVRPVSAEQYLIDSSLLEPADRAETVIYEE